jgi:hypothetical protein
MAYGFEIFDGSGVRTLAVTSRLTRLIYTRFLPAAESDSATVSDFDAATCVAMAVPRLPSLTVANSRVGHNISISGTTITWSPGSASFRADSDLLVFAYQ